VILLGFPITLTIGLGSIFTIINLIWGKRRWIRDLLMGSEKRINKKLVKTSIKLLQRNIEKIIELTVQEGQPERILAFMQEIREKMAAFIKKGDEVKS
jgi:hypothetical protein